MKPSNLERIPVPVETVLNVVVPDLFKLIEGQNISWSTINAEYSKFLYERENKFFKNNNYLKDEVNFHDVLKKLLRVIPDLKNYLSISVLCFVI